MAFEPDSRFEAKILAADELRALLTNQGEAVKQRASQLFPDDPATSGDDLHSQIEVTVVAGRRGPVGIVHAYNWKAGWYELGSARTPAVHALSRAVEEHVGPLDRTEDA